MYFVWYGENYLHDPRADLLLTSASIKVEVSAAGSFDFKLHSDHPLFDEIKERDTVNPVTVYQDDELIFCGDIISIESDFHLGKKVECRGELGWLNDSIVRPYSTLEEECDNVAPSSVDGYFEWLIENHNSQVEATKRFKVGKNEGSLLDGNNYIYRSDSSYPTTGSVIKDKILDSLGGYVQVRHEDGYRYIDLLADFPKVNAQIIDFGVNLLDYVKTDSTDDMATFIVPVGDELESGSAGTQEIKERLTLSSLGDGYVTGDIFKLRDMIYSDSAVKERGWIGAVVEFKGITVAENLLESAVSALKGLITPERTVEVTAIDLAMINPEYEPIFMGQYVRARSNPHNFDSYMLCSAMTVNINQPDKNTFTLGTTFDLLTGVQNKRINALNGTINTVYEAANQISAEAKAAAIMAGTAQSAAEQAQSAADTAQAKAEEAQAQADSAATTASEAATKADDAKQVADEAAQSATNADAKALAAQAALNAMETTIETMQTDISNVQSAAEAAQQTAAGADSKAVEAKTAADTAQADANAANTAAQAAQTAASSAETKAGAAQTAASEAKTAAANASTTAAAAKLDAEQALEDIAALDGELETVSNTMTADYARKTELTEATASLQSQITQNAGEIASTVTRLDTIDETANDVKEQAQAAQTAAGTAQSAADDAQAAADKAQADVNALAVTVTAQGTAINQKADKIELEAYKTEVTNTLGGYYTKTQTDAAIKVSADAVTTTVNKIIDEIAVGGRNLLSNSTEFLVYGAATGISHSLTDDGYLCIVAAAGNENWLSLKLGSNYDRVEDELSNGDLFVISFTMRSDDATTPPLIYIKPGMGYYPLAGVLSTEWSTVWYAGVWNDANEMQPHLGFSDRSGSFEIKNCKIERGNKPTDWTPAPEDVQSDTDNAQATADELAQRVADAESTIQQLADSISMLVRSGESGSLLKQDANGLYYFDISEIEANIESAATGLDELSDVVLDANGEIDVLKTTAEALQARTEYVRSYTDENDNPCLELGEGDSQYKVFVTNMGVRMEDGTEAPAVISKKVLLIEKAVVRDELQFGDEEQVTGVWIWKRRDNGNLGLSWKGGDS